MPSELCPLATLSSRLINGAVSESFSPAGGRSRTTRPSAGRVRPGTRGLASGGAGACPGPSSRMRRSCGHARNTASRLGSPSRLPPDDHDLMPCSHRRLRDRGGRRECDCRIARRAGNRLKAVPPQPPGPIEALSGPRSSRCGVAGCTTRIARVRFRAPSTGSGGDDT